jgi:hypothetical protein
MFAGTRMPNFNLKSETKSVLMFIYYEYYKQHCFIQCARNRHFRQKEIWHENFHIQILIL